MQVINTGTAIQIEWDSLEGTAASVPVAGEYHNCRRIPQCWNICRSTALDCGHTRRMAQPSKPTLLVALPPLLDPCR